MPTLPPLRNTDPGNFWPSSFETWAFSLTKPILLPPKKSTVCTSTLRSLYGAGWKGWPVVCCVDSERLRVLSQVVKAGKESNWFCERSGTSLTETGVSVCGSMNDDIVLRYCSFVVDIGDLKWAAVKANLDRMSQATLKSAPQVILATLGSYGVTTLYDGDQQLKDFSICR